MSNGNTVRYTVAKAPQTGPERAHARIDELEQRIARMEEAHLNLRQAVVLLLGVVESDHANGTVERMTQP